MFCLSKALSLGRSRIDGSRKDVLVVDVWSCVTFWDVILRHFEIKKS